MDDRIKLAEFGLTKCVEYFASCAYSDIGHLPYTILREQLVALLGRDLFPNF